MRRCVRAVFMIVLASTPAALPAAAAVSAQEAAAAAAPCGCLADFDRLIERVEANYVGYKLGVNAENRAAYERLKAALRGRAARAADGDCVLVLRELTGWFRDGHLFIAEAPKLDSAEVLALAAGRERSDRTEAELRAYLERNAGRLAPVEGIWYAQRYRVAVVRDATRGRDFVAVTLTSDDAPWEPGMVRAELKERAEGGYDVVYYAADHSTRHLEAELYKGVLLRMPPVMWGKESPLAPHERGLLDPADPRAPTFRRVDARTVLLSIPSHAPQHAKARLEALIETHEEEILAAETLILDIRGNEGGSSLVTRVLAPFYHTAEQRPPLGPVSYAPLAVASPDHIAQVEAAIARTQRSAPWMIRLLERMRADPGGVVPYRPELAERPPFQPDTTYARPHNIAILMDRGVVSAGEAFVLEAARSTKVTLFGENTGGVIDYQNVEFMRLACERRGLLLGYPTLAASADLPDGGLNGIGVTPHVRIPRDVPDWIAYVAAYYRRDIQ